MSWIILEITISSWRREVPTTLLASCLEGGLKMAVEIHLRQIKTTRNGIRDEGPVYIPLTQRHTRTFWGIKLLPHPPPSLRPIPAAVPILTRISSCPRWADVFLSEMDDMTANRRDMCRSNSLPTRRTSATANGTELADTLGC